jgi:hypothetical protein
MGDVSRRAVLGAGVGTVGLVALSAAGPDAVAAAKDQARIGTTDASAAKASPMSAPLRSDYAEAVGRVFTATRDGRTYRVKLTHLQDLVHTTAKQRPHCFGLMFAPVGKARLHDGMYVLKRAGVRTHKLFISAVGTEGEMQAIINRSH